MPDQSSAASEHALMQEITAPLDTLPDDPLALVAADFPTVMRGYDRHAVDDYVEQVGRLVAELHSTRSPEAAVRRALERVGDQISGVLQRGHETAEQITARSRAEAEDRLEQARREAATIVEAAAQRARELDADADRIWAERQRIIADAEDLSAQLRTVAREAAERFPPDEVRTAPAPSPGPLSVSPWADADEDGEADLDAEEPIELETDLDRAPRADDDEPAPSGPAASPPSVPVPPAAPVTPPAPPVRESSARDEVPEVEGTQRFAPARLTDDRGGDRDPDAGHGDLDSTRVIPPSSDAAQHRREP